MKKRTLFAIIGIALIAGVTLFALKMFGVLPIEPETEVVEEAVAQVLQICSVA